MAILIHNETGTRVKIVHDIDVRDALATGEYQSADPGDDVDLVAMESRPLENTVLTESAQAAFEAEQAAKAAAEKTAKDEAKAKKDATAKAKKDATAKAAQEGDK